VTAMEWTRGHKPVSAGLVGPVLFLGKQKEDVK
jgi:hypothetical protein